MEIKSRLDRVPENVQCRVRVGPLCRRKREAYAMRKVPDQWPIDLQLFCFPPEHVIFNIIIVVDCISFAAPSLQHSTLQISEDFEDRMPFPADTSQDSTDAGATETTALLRGSLATAEQDDRTTSDGVLDDSDDEKMPYAQILLLCYASLAEPVAYFSIFPFVNAMIQSTGSISESSVGFYSGLIESLFSLVQMVLMIFYGRMSDLLGRKPVLVFSLCGVSIATALFGMSRTLWQMILFRCLAGVFAGSSVTIRTMLSENTGKKTQGRAFAWYMFTRNLGIFLGPLVGGGLADPAIQFPGAFGNVQFFIDYPYVLPTFVAGAICMTGTLASLFFLKEVRLKVFDTIGY